MLSFHQFWVSLKYAWRGILAVWSEERNFARMIMIAGGTIILGILVNLSLEEWTIVVILITLVLSLEMFNTASERLLDTVTPHFSPQVRYIKDALAGGVFIASIGAAIIGVLIFLPKILF